MERQELPNELVAAIHTVYEPAGLQVTMPVSREAESAEYEACRFGLNGFKIAFRVAKTTPTKLGQFVTTWKRPGKEIVPFDSSDDIDFLIVSASDGIQSGQFIFNKQALINKKVMSHNGMGGKLAFRIYPSWVKPVAKDAIKSQNWQLEYFVPFDAPDVFLSKISAWFKNGNGSDTRAKRRILTTEKDEGEEGGEEKI